MLIVLLVGLAFCFFQYTRLSNISLPGALGADERQLLAGCKFDDKLFLIHNKINIYSACTIKFKPQ